MRSTGGQPTVAVALHDGFYGAGTGAGLANRAFIRALVDALADGVRLAILPVHLTQASSEHDPAWCDETLRLVDRAGAEVHPVDNGTNGLTRFGGLHAFRHLAISTADTLQRSVTPRADPLAVVAFDVPFLGLPSALPPRLRCSVVAVPRSSGILHDPYDHPRIRFERQGLARLTAAGGRVAAISDHMRQHLVVDYGVPHRAVVDLHDGLVDDDWYFGRPDPTLLPATAHRRGFLLALGRAQPYKGWDDLLEALALLGSRGARLPHSILAAVTDGTTTTYQEHLASRIAALGLDATLITTFSRGIRDLLTHDQIRAVVVPSRVEPFGRIPLEAYAAGATPVVATIAGGLAEQVIDGVTAFTAQPANPPQLADALHRALALTSVERENMREAGRHLAQTRFDYAASIRHFLAHVAPWAIDRPESTLAGTPTPGCSAKRPARRSPSGTIDSTV